MAQFRKATKERAKARIALIGPSGSGKTYSALEIAKAFGSKVAVIDSENESASKYADVFQFDTAPLSTFSPKEYIALIHGAEEAGYEVIIIDSLSHAWMGKNGVLEMVDSASARAKGNSFAGWREVTKEHNALVEALVHCKAHLIVTMRSKAEYVVEKDERTGKSVPKKIGMQPVQREGLEFEFDVVADMDMENNLIVSKTRCPAVNKKMVNCPNAENFGKIIKEWVNSGVEPTARPAQGPGEKPEPKPAQVAKPSGTYMGRLKDYVDAVCNGEPGAFILKLTGGKRSTLDGMTDAQIMILFNRVKADVEAYETAGKAAA